MYSCMNLACLLYIFYERIVDCKHESSAVVLIRRSTIRVFTSLTTQHMTAETPGEPEHTTTDVCRMTTQRDTTWYDAFMRERSSILLLKLQSHAIARKAFKAVCCHQYTSTCDSKFYYLCAFQLILTR